VRGGVRGGTIEVFVSGRASGVMGIDTDAIELEQVEEESYCGEVYIKK
jgi:hypothetical protein